MGKIFHVIVHAYSKWPEVLIMNSTTSQGTMEALRTLLSRYGLREQLVSDNGPQFTSSKLVHFMRANGINHITSAPYHPSSNSQVERFVQTPKRFLTASERVGRSLPHCLAELIPS